MGRHHRDYLDNSVGESAYVHGGGGDNSLAYVDNLSQGTGKGQRQTLAPREPTWRQKVAGTLALICLIPFTAIFALCLFTVASYYVPWGTIAVCALSGSLIILSADLVRRGSL